MLLKLVNVFDNMFLTFYYYWYVEKMVYLEDWNVSLQRQIHCTKNCNVEKNLWFVHKNVRNGPIDSISHPRFLIQCKPNLDFHLAIFIFKVGKRSYYMT